MSGVRCARIRSADRAAGVAGPRDVSGILDDGGRLECGDLATASVCALRQLGASEREIITLYHGRDVSAQDQNAVAEALRGAFPAQRVEAVVGGQTRDLICLSCE